MISPLQNIYSSSPAETIAFGQHLGKTLKSKDIIALDGELASGKTTLIKGIIIGLEGENPDFVTSPTFSLLHIYEGKHSIYHFDLFRLNSSSEFIQMGFEEYLSSNGICLIEWPNIISSLLPPSTLLVQIQHVSEKKRLINLCKNTYKDH